MTPHEKGKAIDAIIMGFVWTVSLLGITGFSIALCIVLGKWVLLLVLMWLIVSLSYYVVNNQ